MLVRESPATDRARQPETMLAAGWTLVAAGTIVALTMLAYIPALRGGFVWDDNDYVTENPTLRDPGGLRKIWFEFDATPQYYPLVFTTFCIEHKLWGLRPFGYHLINVLLHAGGAVLLWRILRRLKVSGAWLAAALFAVHPVHVESVAWITERKNVLSGILALGAVWAYLRHAEFDTPAASRNRSGKWRYYALALACFAAAMLSKTAVCAVPAVILVLLWWQRGHVQPHELTALAPLFAIALFMGGITILVERRHGAVGADWSLSPVERCLAAGRALWFYAAKLVAPLRLTYVYPRWQVDARAGWQYLYPFGVLGVMAGLWALRRRIGRGPIAGVLIFAGTLSPALGFANVYFMRYSFVADHFQYLPSIGLLVPIAAVLANVLGIGRDVEPSAAPRTLAARHLPAMLPLGLLALLTWRQGHIYADLETIWRDTLRKNPSAWIAHNNLGQVLADRGQLAEGMAEFDETLRLKPDHAEAHHNLGLALASLGRRDEAIRRYTTAVRLKPDDPTFRYNFGLALADEGRFDEAIEQFRVALGYKPRHADAFVAWGLALLHQDKLDPAIVQFRRALSVRPDHAAAHNNLGAASLRKGDLHEAVSHFEEALRLKPDSSDAYANLGTALTQQGKLDAAIALYRKALHVGPDWLNVANNLAWLLATTVRPPAEAVEAVQLAERICAQTGHNQPQLLDTLAAAYAAAGRLPEAIQAARRAIDLANSSDQTTLADEISAHLSAYQAGRPYREPLPAIPSER